MSDQNEKPSATGERAKHASETEVVGRTGPDVAVLVGKHLANAPRSRVKTIAMLVGGGLACAGAGGAGVWLLLDKKGAVPQPISVAPTISPTISPNINPTFAPTFNNAPRVPEGQEQWNLIDDAAWSKLEQSLRSMPHVNVDLYWPTGNAAAGSFVQKLAPHLTTGGWHIRTKKGVPEFSDEIAITADPTTRPAAYVFRRWCLEQGLVNAYRDTEGKLGSDVVIWVGAPA
jgi:hypothetical protein